MAEDTFAQLEQRHGAGRIIDYTIGGVDVFFTVPSQADHERFVEMVSDEESNKAVATREYVLACLVHPEREVVKSLFQNWPAVPNEIAKDLRKAALGGMKRREKKS